MASVGMCHPCFITSEFRCWSIPPQIPPGSHPRHLWCASLAQLTLEELLVVREKIKAGEDLMSASFNNPDFALTQDRAGMLEGYTASLASATVWMGQGRGLPYDGRSRVGEWVSKCTAKPTTSPLFLPPLSLQGIRLASVSRSNPLLQIGQAAGETTS